MGTYDLRFQCTGCRRYDSLNSEELFRCQKALQEQGLKFYRCPYGCPDDEDMIIREVLKKGD